MRMMMMISVIWLQVAIALCVPVVKDKTRFIEEKCNDPNEEYTCGPSYEKNCANRFKHPIVLLKICCPGCFCNVGYLKNSAGICVLERDCDKEL
ncbi:venom peptide CtAPI-like [Bombina bombina]|uniref:venom peptide CtAPI-like n=1 Tax=Bombina bombina TaxID=8345 RepID=UPI00235AFA6C|nr:venom peptide CtAPI-like [Bombina bombina]